MSVTGTPEILFSFIRANASSRVDSGEIVSGLTTIPDSYFLTLFTSLICCSISKFLCITPIPPA